LLLDKSTEKEQAYVACFRKTGNLKNPGDLPDPSGEMMHKFPPVLMMTPIYVKARLKALTG